MFVEKTLYSENLFSPHKCLQSIIGYDNLEGDLGTCRLFVVLVNMKEKEKEDTDCTETLLPLISLVAGHSFSPHLLLNYNK